MINFDKISKIKSKKDIKKFKIEEPIFLNNYLFHYLIMTNNIKGMEIATHPIYMENDEGLQGFHLAAKVASETKSLNMLKMLIKKYPEYASNINYLNETFLDYMDISDDIITIIEENKTIDWYRILINNRKSDEEEGTSFINRIFFDGSLKLIFFIISLVNKLKKTNKSFNWNEIDSTPVYQLLFNNNLKTKDIITIIKLIGIEDIIQMLDSEGKSIIYPIIISGNHTILKYLIKMEISLDKYTPIYTWHPFITSYNFETKNNNGKNKYKMSKLIWDHIKEDHDFNSTNKFGENIAFSILNTRLKTAQGDLDLELDILKRNTIWNKVNVDKNSILHLLINLSFDKYHKSLKNININKTQKDSKNKSILDNASGKWLTFLKTLNSEKETCTKNTCTKIDKYDLVNSNTFSSSILDAGLFFIHLDKKYKNLYIPKYSDKIETDMFWENGFDYPDAFINTYNNFPWTIYWQDQYNYHIHPHLNQLINANKNKDKYDYAFVLLSVILPHGGLHAMMLYYDFHNNFIERFDPYGNTHDIDLHIDSILEEELTWNTGFYYLNVKKYLPVAGFQNLSDENNILLQKPGDFGGYCLAWCLWYLEHRIKNYKFSAKQLIQKSITKLLMRENNLIEFIRNYANQLDKNRLKLLEEIGIPKNRTSNQKFNSNEDKLIFKYIIGKLTIS